MDRVDLMDNKLYSKRSVVHLVYQVHQVHYKAFFSPWTCRICFDGVSYKKYFKHNQHFYKYSYE